MTKQLARTHMRRMLDRFGPFLGWSRSVRKPRVRRKKKKKARDCELSVNAPTVDSGVVHCSATLSIPGKDPKELWFRLPEQHIPAITRRADPFILAALLPAIELGRTLHVTGGQTSPSLLRNLAEFQRVWHGWRRFSVIDIDAATMADASVTEGPTLACFSGGVDSAYTVYRLAKNRPQIAAAALMVHGFDIPWQDAEGFYRAACRSRRMLDSLDVPFILMQSNIRDSYPDWPTYFGSAVAAALTVLSGGFRKGLIAGSGTDHLSLIPWGSTPLTDPMLGSLDFPLFHEGDSATRLDKVRTLCDWPEALEHLRFCWQLDPPDGNCGRCMKCVLTALEFRCAGVEPGCFARPVTDDVIIEALGRYEPDAFGDIFFREVLDAALAQGMTDPWIPSLQRVVDTFASE